MRDHGKKYNTAAKNRDIASTYQPKQALEIVKKSAFAKFDETVEVAVRLGVDPRHADQVVRGTVVLPAGTGKSVRVLVIAAGDKAREAQDAGADFVGVEYIQKIKEGWLDFDVLIATPDQMGQLGPLGRVLGPRGSHAEPQGGHGDLQRRQRGEGNEGRQDRVPRRQGRQRPRADRQGLVRPRRAGDELHRLHGSDRPREAGRGEGRVRQERLGLEHDGPRRHVDTNPYRG